MDFAVVLLAILLPSLAYTPTSIIELDDRFYEAKDSGMWLVMLYAPWCGHCKRFLPTFDQIARGLSNGDVQVARLDCTKYPAIANKLKVTGYPSIRIYRNGEYFEYDGERSKEAIMEFTEKVTGPVLRSIGGKDSFSSVQSKHSKGVFFLLVEGNSEQHKLVKQYERFAQNWFHKAFFYKIASHDLPGYISLSEIPAILCVKDGGYVPFPGGSDEDLERWFQNERWTNMPLVKHENIQEIGTCCNKYLVVFVLDLVEKRKANSAIKKVDDLAKALLRRYGDKLKKRFQLVWFDGNALANSFLLRTVPVPSLFVLNVTSLHHYLPEDDAINMTEDALWAFLQRVDNGEVKMRGGRGIVQRIRQFFFEFFSSILLMFFNQPLLACCLFGLPLGIASVICYTICSTDVSLSTDEVYNESDETDSDHEKAE